MTVGKLIKILSKCNPRAKVTVFKETFRHPLEEISHHDVNEAHEELIEQAHEDGGIQFNKDGSQRYNRCVVLSGNYPPYTVEEITRQTEKRAALFEAVKLVGTQTDCQCQGEANCIWCRVRTFLEKAK